MESRTLNPSSSEVAQDWILKTKQLHFFWLLVYPRIIGRIWQYDIDESILRSDFKAYLLDELDLFLEASENAHPGSPTSALLTDLRAVFEKLQIELMPGFNYDYILSEEGLDLPLVKKPELAAVFRNYRDRADAIAQMNLPKTNDEVSALEIDLIPPPARPSTHTSTEVAATGTRARVPLQTGTDTIDAYMYHKQRTQHFPSGRAWQLRGSLLSLMLRATDRIIAEMWYEETVRGQSVRKEFQQRAREIIGDYLELTLREPLLNNFGIQVILEEDPNGHKSGSSHLSPQGLTIYFPKAPGLNEVIEDMALGKAGNPMYSNTYNTSGTG